jgi:putative ABC transport system permease protein
MRAGLWLRFALRDLRSGLQGFWIFLISLALGTAAIAVVGSLSAAIQRGIDEQGQPLLGGDVAFALIHREANPDELAFMTGKGTVSTTATLRAMAIAGDQTTLVEAKAVDDRYPLYGTLQLDGGGGLATALAPRDGVYGAVVDLLLLGRLAIKVGDRVRIGTEDVEVRGTIASEPDRISDGIILGPRLMMSRAALDATGLIQPGSLITWSYRIRLAPPAAAATVTTVMNQAKARFPDAGWRVRSRDNAAQGTDRFVERLGYFMTLVGLASLIVGGAGIANAVAAFVARRVSSIATLKCLGAASRDVFGIYLVEIMLVGLAAIAMGLAAGAAAPLLAEKLLDGILPLPITGRIEWAPLAVAALLGVLVTLAFAVWPLARTRRVPASALFRHRALQVKGRPTRLDIAVTGLALAAMAVIVFARFGEPRITAWFLAGLAVSFAVLMGLARLIVWGAQRLPRASSAVWRYAVGNIHRPGAASASVILALGLGLTLFVTLALTDRTISTELRAGIPERAPAFFFIDVRDHDLAAFTRSLLAEPGVTAVNAAPMLRGRMVSVKGVPVADVKASSDAEWALRGDRGLTYAAALPEGSTLTDGKWWPANYDGPPLVSMVGDVGRGMGLAIGDAITVNVLGREVTATVANFRDVNWRSLGINFVMVFSPNTLQKAPHSDIVTVEMAGGDEAALLNRVAREFPSVTGVRVKDAIALVSDLLAKMLTAIRGANLLTLLTGVLVLAGALAAGLSERLYEAVILKTLGATRRQLVGAFALEYAALGLAAAVFGLAVGTLAAWFLARFILEMPFHFSAAVAILTALIAMVVTVAAGLLVTWGALSAKPAVHLRDE